MYESSARGLSVGDQIFLAVLGERIRSLEETLRDLEGRAAQVRHILVEMYEEEIVLMQQQEIVA